VSLDRRDRRRRGIAVEGDDEIVGAGAAGRNGADGGAADRTVLPRWFRSTA
jgi:hypothetical protein